MRRREESLITLGGSSQIDEALEVLISGRFLNAQKAPKVGQANDLIS